MSRTSPRPKDTAPSRFDLSFDELAVIVAGLGAPRYRAAQLWQGFYEGGQDLDDIAVLPKALRQALLSRPELHAPLTLAHESLSEADQTVKWLWSLRDGAQIETVLMHYPERSTVCVSTQAGCAMACGFCATGQSGFQRQLRSGEIVGQVVAARARAAENGRRLSNVVFMGMGEPLANYDAVWSAVERLHDDKAVGLSARHLTISTVGIVPGIRRLATEALPVNLAVSLHAANDELRDGLVPINRTYPLGALIGACEEYASAKARRLSLEWALIDGVNDRPSDAAELAEIAHHLHAHVNLIPLNPTPGYPAVGTPAAGVRAFRDSLLGMRVNATTRRNRGAGIDAACGQLRSAVGSRQGSDGRSPVDIRARTASRRDDTGTVGRLAPR